jgi:putative heme-binding domain-containing protein
MLREIANEGGNDPSSRRHAIVALASLDAAGALTALPAALPALPDDNERLELWRGVLKAKDFADRLVTEIARDTAPWKNAAPKIGVRAAREAGKNGAKLLAALTPLAGLTASEASMPKDFKALADLAKRDGDPARGEMIYRRSALVCTTCHAIGGAGGKVGPDMTSLGASAPLDYIVESVLEPALKVKEGYNAVAFTLKDGTQATGIQARETAQEFILRDVTGREQAVAKAQIATTTNIGSLMPAGLTNQLADRERLDLFAFLGELGKPGPYDASKGKVARVWWLFPGADADKVVVGQIKWESAFPGYTLVDGRFVKDLLAAAAPLVANGSDTLMAVAQFQAAGKTRLTLTGAAKAWLDGKPLALTEDLAPELSEGVHTLAVKLDVNALPAHLRAESPDARFLGN